MIEASASGSFANIEAFFKLMNSDQIYAGLSKYGAEGVAALASATPIDSGETKNAWSYEIVKTKGTYSIIWSNSHMAGPTPVVILLQHGHGTGNGGYIQGRDFINPALKPIFDRISSEVWRVVTGR